MNYLTGVAKNYLQLQLTLYWHRFNLNVKSKQYLGRWNIDYCPNKIDMKVKLANEDNCGPTGRYRMK